MAEAMPLQSELNLSTILLRGGKRMKNEKIERCAGILSSTRDV
jgi:hypothetical protein